MNNDLTYKNLGKNLTLSILLLVAILILPSRFAFAQTSNNSASDSIKHIYMAKMRDSIMFVYMQKAALKYPAIRQLTISNDYVHKGNFESKLYGNDFFKSKIQIIRNNVNFNIPGVYWGHNLLSSNFGIQYQHIKLTEMHNNSGSLPVNETTLDKTTLNFGIRYNRTDSLFNLPINYNIGFASKFSPDMTKFRLMATGVVFVQVIRNPKTSLSLGAVVSTNPSSPAPLLPLISISYKPGIWDMELFADIPYRLALRKEFTPKSSISLGVDIDESLTFMDLQYSNLPHDVIYSSLDVKKGLTYEYLISKNIVLGISGGLMTTYSSNLINRTDYKSKNSIIDNKSGTEPYLNISISMLPFLRSHKIK